MKKLFLVVLILAAFPFAKANACSCMPANTSRDKRLIEEAVYMGTFEILSQNNDFSVYQNFMKALTTGRISYLFFHENSYTLKPIQIFKGTLTEPIKIKVDLSSSCETRRSVGSIYDEAIFLNKNGEYRLGGNCSRIRKEKYDELREEAGKK